MPILPTEQEVSYMIAHSGDTLVANGIACASICGIFSIAFIWLRFYSQWHVQRRHSLTLSDIFIVLAWIFFASFDIGAAATTRYGGGRHAIFITNPRLIQILFILDENTYCYAMAFIKLSILSLYANIFPSRRFRYFLWAVAVFVIAWALSIANVAIFQCRPIAYGWDPTIEGSCLNYGLVVLVSGIINIITDFTILCMPIPLIWRLHATRQKKVELSIIFALGGSACIVSIIRLPFALRVGSTSDGSWDNMPAGMISIVELMTGILVACVPTYRPLYKQLFHHSASTTYGSTSNWSFSLKRRKEAHDFGEDCSRHVNISADQFLGDPRPGINVTNQIELVVHTNRGGNWVRVPDE
ncbi:uncharacterized protein F4807DRAFT_466395 [Annulohypoxylon truncatum]|uniref:uncharacterized protein n=1 Tax=Annulohypoxylon truncatum TaxID=327061 RepID=UPI0020084E12|nr:uncharacterized protein F4807DRAFT_466395 [Annulohypoxylon truncatum]KAI1215083.1 hypothetical protein F4807DRAFT_466395 [Annulohypoxylon truncatum]